MDERMKQRAVGAAVLAALAIIFIPMALDFSKEKGQESVDLTLPPPPEGEYKTVTIPMNEWSDKSVADIVPERSLPEADSADEILDAEVVTPAVPVAVAPKAIIVQPEPPAVETSATPPPVQQQAVKPTESKPAAPPASVASAPAAPLKVVPKPQLAGPTTGAKAWAVQVGSFSQRKNAEALRNRLRKMGYPAFVTSSEADGKTIVRVRIGPELARVEADRIKSEIERQLKLQAMVVPHR